MNITIEQIVRLPIQTNIRHITQKTPHRQKKRNKRNSFKKYICAT